MKKILFFLISFFSLVFYSNSLYIHLKKGEKKCFYDEFYSEIILNRDISFSNNDDKRLEIEILSEDDNKLIYKHESGKLNGKFSLSIEKTGHFKICLLSKDPDYYNRRNFIKLSMIIDTDQDELEDGAISAKTKDFKTVDGDVRKLFQKTSDILKMQDFQMKREDDFSEINFANSSRMVFITVVQVVIIAIIGIWQIFALRKVFK